MFVHQSIPTQQKVKPMTSHLPEVTSTSAERLNALKEAKALLFIPGAEVTGPFSKSSTQPVAPQPDELFRVAEYITTGHDYLDTHPKGKRRPLIQNINVTAVGMPQEVAEQFIGDDFLDHLANHTHKDEPEHLPQDPEDRPRFGGSVSDFK